MSATDRDELDARRFRALASGAYDTIVELDAEGRVLYASPASDAAPEALADRAGPERVHPDDRGLVADLLGRLFAEAGHLRATFRVFASSGAVRWVECTGTRFESPQGAPRVLLLSRDVTEQKDTEARLDANQERFRLIVENAYDMIGELDEQGRVLYANDRVGDLFGANEEEVAEMRLHPEDEPVVLSAWERALSGGEPPKLTYRVAVADGPWRWLEARYRRVTDSQGRHRIIVIARDCTEAVEAERRLRESEERYRQLVETSPLGIAVLQDRVVVYANPSGAAICGADSPDALLGCRFEDLLAPTQARDVRDRLETLERGGKVAEISELRILGLDGQERSIVATGSTVEFQGRPAYQGLLRDVTALRRVEREHRRLELQLQEARKLESLGLLAGGIAHDFNNLLAVILGNARFAQRECAGDADLVEALEDAIDAGEQAARLTGQLLAYAGRRSPDVRAADLGELVEANASLLGSALPRHAELQLALDPDAPSVRADLVQLEQVLMNLVMNAGEAIDEAPGWVRVSTGRVGIDAEIAARCIGGSEVRSGLYAFLEVQDSGHGMDAATRERIFEPFFTTKSEGHGLGLAAVLGLVRGHGGGIELDSSPGEGTRVRIYLPAIEDVPATYLDRGNAVLVLESNRETRALLCDVLAERGVATLEAASTEQAIDLQRRHADEIGLVIGDPRDPSCVTALRALRGAHPGLPLLLLGEPARDGIVAELARSGPAQVLHRPLEREAVHAQLDGLLDKD